MGTPNAVEAVRRAQDALRVFVANSYNPEQYRENLGALEVAMRSALDAVSRLDRELVSAKATAKYAAGDIRQANEAVKRSQVASASGIARLASFSPTGPHVYLLYGEAKRVLYVGQSENVIARLGNHLTHPERRDRIKEISILKCKDYDDMMQCEAQLIRRHQPEWNIKGNPAAPRNAQKESA